MAELNQQISLITLLRDRSFPEQWHLVMHGIDLGESEKVYTSLHKALNAIASQMWREVETGTNWLQRSA